MFFLVEFLFVSDSSGMVPECLEDVLRLLDFTKDSKSDFKNFLKWGSGSGSGNRSLEQH